MRDHLLVQDCLAGRSFRVGGFLLLQVGSQLSHCVPSQLLGGVRFSPGLQVLLEFCCIECDPAAQLLEVLEIALEERLVMLQDLELCLQDKIITVCT